MSASQIQELIDRLGHLIRSEIHLRGVDHDLQPVQLNTLHYLSRCNRYSDTHQGVTDYLGHTKGTVSQTLSALERKGLVRKVQDPNDGRKAHLRLTPTGKNLLNKIMPTRMVSQAWEGLEGKTRKHLLDGLNSLLMESQRRNGFKAFGVCHSCRYNSKKGQSAYFCELTQEALTPAEIHLICREHTE